MSLASPFFSALVNKPIAHVWRGYGSALFIEFGEIIEHNGKTTDAKRPRGEISLMIEWSWRIERPRSILGGSWSSENKWPGMFRQLVGTTVTEVHTFGALPEILVSLSNGLRVASFMTADGQPQWALITRTPKLGSLGVQRGVLHVQPPDL